MAAVHARQFGSRESKRRATYNSQKKRPARLGLKRGYNLIVSIRLHPLLSQICRLGLPWLRTFAKAARQDKFFLMALLVLCNRTMTNGKKTVLIAQQKNDWRDLLIHVIERCGCDVIAVSNPEDITEATSAGIDLILLDLGLLKERAEIIITDLQKDLSTKHIPIICETRYGNDLSVRQVVQAGAKEILYKPFDLTDVPSILRRHLSNEPSCTEKRLPAA